MDFQTIVDSLPIMACVVSVERLDGDDYGKFRIVTGNKAYIDSIENPAPGTQMLTDKFTPNAEYTTYLTRDLNFEDACINSAVKKKCLHSYAHPDRMPVWFNMFFLPLWPDEGNLSYCIYMMEINFEADSKQFSSISGEMASSVLETTIRLRGTNDFSSAIKDVVAGIRELCGAEHCCILTMNEIERYCEVLGEDFAEGSPLLPMDRYLDEEFYEIAESWESTIAGSNCLIVKNKRDMDVIKERNPVWHASLTGAGAQNIVLFPLKSRNQLLGYMWALNFDSERADKIKQTLELTTFIVGSELGNYLLLERFRILSSKDMLTGVMNRNEMNNYVDSLCRGEKENESVGVIFADLNGLKAVNDLEGHNAGDLLLKNAASVLKEVFDEKEIFRAGGDEFSIIVTGIDQDGLDAKIEKIRTCCEKYDNLFFALGGAVETDSRYVRLALRSADERMYEDKKLFYEKHPDRIDEKRNVQSGKEETAEEFRERSLYHEMNYDHLTGLPRMTHFFKQAEIWRKSYHDKGIPAALVFINLNGMRYYNQKYGFAEGDILLKSFATIISDVFGEDKCSRFGQDHFAAFSDTESVEKKLKKVIREAKTCNGGRSLPVGAGIYPDSMGMVEASLACDRAKDACEQKKDENKSYYNYFDEKMLARENNRHYIVDNLDRAINEGWVKAYYQPIVRATSRRVCDEEALARWIDPVKGMLSPADFIPILENERLIYKVDLHIVDIILERMKQQKAEGMYIVPISVNLSRTDFETCDIVEEIKNRVEAAGIPTDLITIEITESVIGQNLEFMKEQISRFQNYGFKVWMDDFGSGYSSLDLLQEMQFDLIKFDMRFMRQFDNNPRSRVLLTELMRMALSLGIETVCEGVETQEQAEFLSEIGCTKMQGYYFCKPISWDEIKNRYRNSMQIGFEDPDEEEYHKTIGGINLYDLGAISNEDIETVNQYFNTIPMAVVESDGITMQITRSNKSYRKFIGRFFEGRQTGQLEAMVDVARGFGGSFANAIKQCTNIGQKVFINEPLPNGSDVNAFIRKIAYNPVSGLSAYAVAVLGITPRNEETITFMSIARALSADYLYVYHVNLDTEEFIEYTPDAENADITAERRGSDFFNASRKDARKYLDKDDQEDFVREFTRENVINTIDRYGAFTYTYRLLVDGDYQYVNMKAVRLGKGRNNIIIGVNRSSDDNDSDKQ
ncbi:MAG: EAL domain-containing protein [Lachnospiraceae bacterium]|nr:EAL domain-containing protein [Lachnospiraceae bacterium]